MDEWKFVIKCYKIGVRLLTTTVQELKHMNCIVAVVIAILALVIHIANKFFEEKIEICPKMFSRCLLIKQRHRLRLNNRRIKISKIKR